MHSIYTIGHSIHSIDEFLDMLKSFDIKNLVDIRHLPGSRRVPQFDKENLEIVLPENNINYIFLKDLGGYRKVKKDSKNTGWRNMSFRGYADYMETADFERGIKTLKNIAIKDLTAIMCAEAVWWRCHRSMIADYLKWQGWQVFHIMGIKKATDHPYTSVAQIINGKLSYQE